VRLIERERERAVPTPEGRQLLAKVGPALELIAEAIGDLAGPARNRVTLTLPRSLAALWLAPRLASLYERHGEIEVVMIPTERIVDLRREGVDIGIRTGTGAWPELKSCHLFDDRTFPVAAPELARTIASEGWNTARTSSRFILNAFHPDEWLIWCTARGLELPPRRRTKSLSSFDLVLQAALSGLGLAMGRRPMVDDALESGRLAAPFGTDGVVCAAYFAVWSSARAHTRAARNVLNWLLETVGVASTAPSVEM
jgi:LysR family transcriptional regulator, glycine cleavage system transcriptional activator